MVSIIHLIGSHNVCVLSPSISITRDYIKKKTLEKLLLLSVRSWLDDQVVILGYHANSRPVHSGDTPSLQRNTRIGQEETIKKGKHKICTN